MSNDNRQKLVDIVATLLEIEPSTVSSATSPETAPQWDSLNHVSICMAVSEEFNVPVSTDQMASIRSVGDLIGLLNARGVACDP